MHVTFTGFPGQISVPLVTRLLQDETYREATWTLLVEERRLPQAERHMAHLDRLYPGWAQKVTLRPGDLSSPHFGWDPSLWQEETRRTTHLFHLAALYDLSVPKDVSFRVNILGTERVLEFLKAIPEPELFFYVSTAYVSGTREGIVYEEELDTLSFKNWYEWGKYEAERKVREIHTSVPTVIVRPTIVYGDARTGATAKLDGLYFFFQLFHRLRFSPWIPGIPEGEGQAEGQFIPRDYTVEAMATLAQLPEARGRTFHLAHPRPYTMREVYHLVLETYLGRKPRGTLSLRHFRRLLHLPGVAAWLKIAPEAVDYFDVRVHFDRSNTEALLDPRGIVPPDLKEVLPAIAEGFRRFKL
ncbi:MAG: SDR family oxidoreductase [Clostridiales bacterium]|nr:SDR family oxidoreductase [Clostridiales bacterium]